MQKKYQKLLFWILFIVIFSLLVLIATFYDYSISEILAQKGFANGNYFSSNLFGRIFEVIGEMPLYLFLMSAFAILLVNCKNIQKKNLRVILQIVFYIGGCVSCFYGIYKIGKYLSQLYPDKLAYLHDHFLTYSIMFILALFIQFVFCFLLFKKLPSTCQKLLPLACIILFTAACSQLIVQGIKPIFGRERYRAIYYLNYYGFEHQGFTRWYIINGSSMKIAASYQGDSYITSTFFSSFPSGHTCGAGITYTLMFLPLYFEKFNQKKYKWLFILLPIFITGIVGFSRIVMGAHYMSDVLFGGTVAFLSAIFGYKLYSLLLKKIKTAKN